MNVSQIVDLLGGDSLLHHACRPIPRDTLELPGPDFVDRVFAASARNPRVLVSLQRLFDSGRLGGTGYLSILPVDQGIEHAALYVFQKNPDYFGPEAIVRLAIESGCSAVASTLGVLELCSRKHAHRIPFVLKLNHNEFLTHPNRYDQVMFASPRQAWDLGAAAVGATIYFGSPESSRQLVEVSRAFQEAHDLGMATILWCYLRNDNFGDYHAAADLTGQANHLGATIGADIVKQKLPTCNQGYVAPALKQDFKFKTQGIEYPRLTGQDHPIDLCRLQVANCYMGRVGLINSGGESKGDGLEDDLKEAVTTAVINKRAGGMGLICGRKAFQRPLDEGIRLLHAIQDVYLCKEVTVA